MVRVRSEWDTPTRSRVRLMRDLGRPAWEIKRRTGVPERTQRLIGISGTDRRLGKQRTGRKKVIADSQIDTMIQDLIGRYTIRTLDWHQLIKKYDLEVSPRTLARRFRDRGFYKCRACQKPWLSHHHTHLRLQFSKEWKDTPLWRVKLIHYSDETHFLRNSRRTAWVLRKPSERHCADCTQKSKRKYGWTTELHVWSMIAYNYKGPLVWYNDTGGKNITMEIYTTRILPIVVARKEELDRRDEGMIFQEDNDASHGTRSFENAARYYKIEKDLDFIEDWPPYSPDLSPIENIWRILKQRLKAHRSWSSKDELKEAIEAEWDKISLDEINRYIIGAEKGRKRGWGWTDRLGVCIERNGLMTPF
jgi:transposase